MRISWVTFDAPVRVPDGSLTSNTASLRYRVLSPIGHMPKGRHQHRILQLTAATSPATRDAALEADLIVFSKSFLPANEELARRAREAGLTVVFDVCDNHYDDPGLGGHYRAMTALADRVVCNTAEMARVAAPFAARPATVIPDPYEGVRRPPEFAPAAPLRLLWFGHPANLDSLQAAMPDLIAFGRERPLVLTILTQAGESLVKGAQAFSAKHAGVVEMRVEPWSLEAQWRALAHCDVVVIPSLPDPRKAVKSANRMVEALRAGRPVVAQPMPAYQAFAAWTPVGERLSEGLRELMADPASVAGRVAAAQDHIAVAHDPGRLGELWSDLFDEAREAAAP
jgi:glycosyltransferase involved in cell wall biosynthesis